MAFRHDVIEKNSILLLVLTLITVAIGGIVVQSAQVGDNRFTAGSEPYQVAGIVA